ncbi:MAG: WS/DGAT/MGAT family O-acyltransferase [Acidimicrobiales bacterium]
MRLVAPLDAVFFVPETAEQHMHVAGLEIFELPAGAGGDWLVELYRRNIGPGEVAPMFRQRAERSLAALGAWVWQVDDHLDLEHHVRRWALPRPGGASELAGMASFLHGTSLDRHRPLWEAHLIEGLERRRFALYARFHHALMDGASAMRLLERSLSSDPDRRGMPPPWSPDGLARAADGDCSDSSEAEGSELGRLVGAAARVAVAGSEVFSVVPSMLRAAESVLMGQVVGLPAPAPRTVFNVTITGWRRFGARSWSLERVRRVARAAAATVNDVVLAMSASALRRYLDELGALPDDPLVAMTPVSLRSGRPAGASERPLAGNAVAAILCNLATNVADPSERLATIMSSMARGKESLAGLTPAQAVAVSAVAMAPMALAALPLARHVSRPPFNLVISNLPGPAKDLFYDGARLEAMYPLSIPTHNQGLNITVVSYSGRLQFGLTGCSRTVPHIDRLLVHLETGLSELEAVTGMDPVPGQPAGRR